MVGSLVLFNKNKPRERPISAENKILSDRNCRIRTNRPIRETPKKAEYRYNLSNFGYIVNFTHLFTC